MDPAAFRRRCGDGFISSVITGGEFYGVIEIHTSNEQDKQSISASLSVNAPTWTAAAEFNQSVNSTVAHKTVTVWTYQRGGAGAAQSGVTTVQEMLDRATSMPANVAGANAVLVDVSVMSYGHLALPNDLRSPIDTSNQQEVEAEIVGAKNEAKDLSGRFNYALLHASEYKPFDATAAQVAVNSYSRNLNLLRSAASSCYMDYTKCVMPQLQVVATLAPVPLVPITACAEANNIRQYGGIVNGICGAKKKEDVIAWQYAIDRCRQSGGTPPACTSVEYMPGLGSVIFHPGH